MFVCSFVLINIFLFLEKMAGTTEVTKVLYIVVVSDEDDDCKNEKISLSFRYTRPVLQSTFQLMGCKARHAFKVHYHFCVFMFIC